MDFGAALERVLHWSMQLEDDYFGRMAWAEMQWMSKKGPSSLIDARGIDRILYHERLGHIKGGLPKAWVHAKMNELMNRDAPEGKIPVKYTREQAEEERAVEREASLRIR